MAYVVYVSVEYISLNMGNTSVVIVLVTLLLMRLWLW